MKSGYKEDLPLEEAKKLALKMLAKAMDATSMTGEKVEVSTLSFNSKNKLEWKTYKEAEVDALLAETTLTDDSTE